LSIVLMLLLFDSLYDRRTILWSTSGDRFGMECTIQASLANNEFHCLDTGSSPSLSRSSSLLNLNGNNNNNTTITLQLSESSNYLYEVCQAFIHNISRIITFEVYMRITCDYVVVCATWLV
jgi:hypothetical protein